MIGGEQKKKLTTTRIKTEEEKWEKVFRDHHYTIHYDFNSVQEYKLTNPNTFAFTNAIF